MWGALCAATVGIFFSVGGVRRKRSCPETDSDSYGDRYHISNPGGPYRHCDSAQQCNYYSNFLDYSDSNHRPDCYCYFNPYSNRNRDVDNNCHGEPDCHRYRNDNRNRDADRNRHCNCHGDRNRDSKYDSDYDCYSDPNSHRWTSNNSVDQSGSLRVQRSGGAN
jgi:hypothetical protein